MSGLFKISIASTGRRGWKDTFYVTAEISTEGHFLSLFCQLMVVECVPCTLLFCSLLCVFSSSPPSVFFSVSADWQIEVEVSPSPPGPAAHCDISPPPPPLGVRLCWYDRVTSGGHRLRKILPQWPKSELLPRFEGLKKMLWKRTPENFLIKLEASTQWSVACQQCTP